MSLADFEPWPAAPYPDLLRLGRGTRLWVWDLDLQPIACMELALYTLLVEETVRPGLPSRISPGVHAVLWKTGTLPVAADFAVLQGQLDMASMEGVWQPWAAVVLGHLVF